MLCGDSLCDACAAILASMVVVELAFMSPVTDSTAVAGTMFASACTIPRAKRGLNIAVVLAAAMPVGIMHMIANRAGAAEFRTGARTDVLPVTVVALAVMFALCVRTASCLRAHVLVCVCVCVCTRARDRVRRHGRARVHVYISACASAGKRLWMVQAAHATARQTTQGKRNHTCEWGEPAPEIMPYLVTLFASKWASNAVRWTLP